MDDTISELDQKKYENFIDSLSSVKKPIYIIGHRDFCFDSIGSGLGLKRLLERHSIEAKFCFEKPENVGFPQNNALYSQLSLEHYVANPKDIEKDSSVIYVDCHLGGGNLHKIKGFPFAIIDHHTLSQKEKKMLNDKRIIYYDIEPSPSCTSMILKYLLSSGNLDFKRDSIEDVKLATAMLVGMRVDTKKFLLKSDMSIEHKFAPYLEKVANLDLIREFEERKSPPAVLRILTDTNFTTPIGRYRVGIINLDKLGFEVGTDLLSATVESLRDIGDASVNILIGYSRNKNSAIIRIRSDDAAYHAQEELVRLFGSGGGKEGSGGAELSLRELIGNLSLDKRVIRSPRLESRIESSIEKRLESFS